MPLTHKEATRQFKTVTRECEYHGVQQMEMGHCPRCAEEIVHGGAVRSIRGMMASSLEALAKRLK